MSLLALAHAAPAGPPFNATYYATIATVIPVLFLAFIVQGGGYNELLTAALPPARTIRSDHPVRNTQRPDGWALLLAYGAWFILYFGLFGEAVALSALYHESESVFPDQRLAVSLTTGLLLIAVTGLPLVRFSRTSRLVRGLDPPPDTAPPETPQALGISRPRNPVRYPPPPMMPKWAKRAFQEAENTPNIRGG